MADVLDEELARGIKQARMKPQHFAIVAKGPSVLKVFVRRKRIKPKEIKEARFELKGNNVVEGLVQGDGPVLVFQVVGEEPSIKTLSLKEYLSEQTGLTVKVQFQVVAELTDIGEEDEEAPPEAPPMPTSSAAAEGTVPPAPPPPRTAAAATESTPPAAPPSPTGDDALLKQLVETMQKLGPTIQSAVTTFPALRDEIVKWVAKFHEQVKAKDAEKAKGTLLKLGELLKKMPGGAPRAAKADEKKPPTAASAADTKAGQEPPKAPPPPQATSSAEQVPPAPPVPPAAAALSAQWEKAFAAIDDRYQAAIAGAPDEIASKLRVIHTYATEQAEAGGYDKALAALKRLGPLLDQAEQGVPAGSEGRLVETRKFLLTRFQEIKTDLRRELGGLQKAIDDTVEGEDAAELAGAIGERLDALLEELQDGIDESINAGDDFKTAKATIRALQAEVKGDELIRHLADNPLVPGDGFAAAIVGGLDDIAAQLAG